jgi:hypothetical protein
MMTADMQDYLFDLRGSLILKNAVNADLLGALNRSLDAFPKLEFGAWHGNVQRFDNNGDAGVELQNIVEGGEPFERLIDHPSWVDLVHRYCGEAQTYVDGLFIDECFATIRRTGGFFPIHSGGHEGVVRCQYKFLNGRFYCGQVNILTALTDIGPGDGGTLVIPGSHKSNLGHPDARYYDAGGRAVRADQLEGVIEVHLQAGDALLFCDALCHGATTRTNPGERRAVIYRYGPKWGQTRYGYRYSDELLARLTPERRRILQPIAPRVPPRAPAHPLPEA